MSAYSSTRRPSAGALPGLTAPLAGAGPSAPSEAVPPPAAPPSATHPLHEQPQPIASSSRNPQLGPHPYFRYPTPTPEQIEDELPPYWEAENVPLGPLLDRLARKSYGGMRVLVEKTYGSRRRHPADNTDFLHLRRGKSQNISSNMQKQRARPFSSTSQCFDGRLLSTSPRLLHRT